MKYIIFFIFTDSLSVFCFSQNYIQNSNESNCVKKCNSVDECMILIQSKVYYNFYMPPLGGEEVENILSLSLTSGGAVQEYSLASITNKKFDDSILLAVRKVKDFCEIRGISGEDYEKYFKTISIKFSSKK